MVQSLVELLFGLFWGALILLIVSCMLVRLLRLYERSAMKVTISART
jgi:hypothetical protein